MIASALFWLAVYLTVCSTFCFVVHRACGGIHVLQSAGWFHGSAAVVALILYRVIA